MIMVLHSSYSVGILQFTLLLIVWQILQCTQRVTGSIDYSDDEKLGSEQQYIINNGFSLGERDPDEIHYHESLALLPDLILGKRAGKSGKSRKLRSGTMDRTRYRGTKLKKHPEAGLKAGEIVRLLMDMAERRNIAFNNKAIRYGLS